jgi:hypothetical protein
MSGNLRNERIESAHNRRGQAFFIGVVAGLAAEGF